VAWPQRCQGTYIDSWLQQALLFLVADALDAT
jgi:hypothetical protein